MTPLLVLRPEPGASATVAAIAARGRPAIRAPLFAIVPLAPSWPVGFVMPDALLLTSANAARALAGWAAPLLPLPVYAVGAATAAAARARGLAVTATGDADAAAIVARAAAAGVTRLLHLAGREHRAVTHPGLTIDRLICYAADPVSALPAAARAAIVAGAVALLHAPRTAHLFGTLVDAAGLARGGVAVAALSPAVAEAAGPGWRRVATAGRVHEAALLATAAELCERHDRETP